MGIYRLSNRVVSAIRNVDCRMRLLSSSPDAVACAVLSAKRPDAKNPLRTADTTTAAALTTSMRLGAGIRVNSFRLCTALDFRRAQKSFRDAGARIQGCACALRTDEQNDHVRPHQRSASQLAGRHRLEPTDSRRRSSRVIRRHAIATWSALHPVHEDSGPNIAGCFRAKHVRWQHEFWHQLGHAAQVIACGRCKCRFRWRSGPG